MWTIVRIYVIGLSSAFTARSKFTEKHLFYNSLLGGACKGVLLMSNRVVLNHFLAKIMLLNLDSSVDRLEQEITH